jgi:hypothetical protein
MKDTHTMFTIYISKALRHQIREASAKHDQEMSEWARNAIESYLKFVEPSLPRPSPALRKKPVKEATNEQINDSIESPSTS